MRTRKSNSILPSLKQEKTHKHLKDSHHQFFSPTIVNSHSPSLIPSSFSFFYIRRDISSLDEARKRYYFIKSLRPINEGNYSQCTRCCEKLSRFIRSRGSKKCLKLLDTLEVQLSYISGLRVILEHCKNAKKFKFNLGSYAFNGRTEGATGIIKAIKYAINKRASSLIIMDHWHMYESLKQTNYLLEAIRFRPIKEFSYDSEFPSSNVSYLKNTFIHDSLVGINQKVWKMRQLKYVHLGSIHQFLFTELSYQDILNRLTKLEETKIMDFFPARFPFLEEKIQIEGTRQTINFFNTFYNFRTLKKLSLEINDYSVDFFRRLCLENHCLTALYLNIVRFDNLSLTKPSKSSVPEGFEDAWKSIPNLQTLESLTITHYSLVEEDPESPPLFSIAPIAHLKNLKSFTIETNNGVRRRLINYGELGIALHELEHLKFLRLTSYLTSQDLSQMIINSMNSLSELEEIELQFEMYQEIKITKDFISWMQNKTKARLLNLQLGAKMNIGGDGSTILPESIYNCCQAILKLKNLKYLKLGFGCPRHSFPLRQPSLKYFKTKEDKSIISNFLKELKGIRKFVLDVGSGYLDDEEMRRIIAGFRGFTKLKFLAFGGNFSEVSSLALYDMIEFIKKIKRENKVKDLIIRPVEYNGKNERELINLIQELYGFSGIQRYYLSMIDI